LFGKWNKTVWFVRLCRLSGKIRGTEETALVNIRTILAELKAERSRLNRAIAALERLVAANQKAKKSPRASAQRRRDALSSAPAEKRGQLLMFRKIRRSAPAKPSKAEEA
jgi:septal ring factor EnvC (AmiA/AmiB activator)